MADQETVRKLVRLIHSTMQQRLRYSPFFSCDEECIDLENHNDSYFRLCLASGESFAMVNVLIEEGDKAVSVYLCQVGGEPVYKCKSISPQYAVDAMLEKLIKPRI